MSRKAAARFLFQVRSDSELRARLEPNPTPDSYVEEGARAGLEFTIEELRGVVGAEQFYQKTIDDPALYARLSAAPHEEAVVEMARRMGFECRLEDLQAVLLSSGGEELTDSDMDSVAGGAGFSFPDVCKTPSPLASPVPIPYPRGW